MLSTFTTDGSIGILARHSPLLAMLEPTELRLYRSRTEFVRFAQAEGYLQFVENHALVLVEEAIPPESLERETLEERLAEARSALDRAPEGSRSGRGPSATPSATKLSSRRVLLARRSPARRGGSQ